MAHDWIKEMNRALNEDPSKILSNHPFEVVSTHGKIGNCFGDDWRIVYVVQKDEN